MASDRLSEAMFVGVSALLFAGSTTLTIVWCASMSAMGMSMPGGWTMSMVWMRMPGQTWPGAAASFLVMWVVMMVAMMLPSLVPMLWRYRHAVAKTGETRLGALTALVGIGYFIVWTVFGMAVFLLGVALAEVEMQQPAMARAVPIAIGAVVLIAGALQFTAWKARHLACCREAGPGRGRTLPSDAGTAWRHGLRLGLHCSQCCAGLIVILLVLGVMDLRVMAVVAAAITIERLAPASEHVARAIGAVIVGAALFWSRAQLGSDDVWRFHLQPRSDSRAFEVSGEPIGLVDRAESSDVDQRMQSTRLNHSRQQKDRDICHFLPSPSSIRFDPQATMRSA